MIFKGLFKALKWLNGAEWHSAQYALGNATEKHATAKRYADRLIERSPDAKSVLDLILFVRFLFKLGTL